MNLFVPLKQLADNTLNPFDEIALEAALRFRDAPESLPWCDAVQITVLSVGPETWEDGLRTALAMGADRAVRVEAPTDLEPLLVAKCLAALARKENVDLILTGRQSVDEDHHQTGQMIAALLGWGQATCAAEIGFQPSPVEHNEDLTHLPPTKHPAEAIVLREVEGGLERWALPLPAVITADLRLNAIHETGGPRYASLPNIMKARRKPLERLTPAMLGVEMTPRSRCLALRPPPARPPGKRVETVQELARTLRAMNLS